MNCRSFVLSGLCLLISTTALAFGPARLKVAPEFRSYAPLDAAGESALSEIQGKLWQKAKFITLNFPTDSIKIALKQTVTVSFENNILRIISEAGDQRAELAGISSGRTCQYSSDNFKTPVLFKGQKVYDDGSFQIALGIDYLKGIAVDKQENKIRIELLDPAAFSLPDAYDPDVGRDLNLEKYPQEKLIQMVVLKWNKNSPNSLTLRGISEAATGTDEFETDYSSK